MSCFQFVRGSKIDNKKKKRGTDHRKQQLEVKQLSSKPHRRRSVIPPITPRMDMLGPTKRINHVVPEGRISERSYYNALQPSGEHLPSVLAKTSTVPKSNKSSPEYLHQNDSLLGVGRHPQSVAKPQSSTNGTQGFYSGSPAMHKNDTLLPMVTNQLEKIGETNTEVLLITPPKQHGNSRSEQNQEKSDLKISEKKPVKERIAKVPSTDHNSTRNRSYRSDAVPVTLNCLEYAADEKENDELIVRKHINRSSAEYRPTVTKQERRAGTADIIREHVNSGLTGVGDLSLGASNNYKCASGPRNNYNCFPNRTHSATTCVLQDHNAKPTQSNEGRHYDKRGLLNRNHPSCSTKDRTRVRKSNITLDYQHQNNIENVKCNNRNIYIKLPDTRNESLYQSNGNSSVVPKNLNVHSQFVDTNYQKRLDDSDFDHRYKLENGNKSSNKNSPSAQRAEPLKSSVMEFKDDAEHEKSTSDQKIVPSEQMYYDGVQSPLQSPNTEKVTSTVYAEDGQGNAAVDDELLHDLLLQSFTIINHRDVDHPAGFEALDPKINKPASADKGLNVLGQEIQTPRAATQINKNETARAKRRKSKEQNHRHVLSKTPAKTTLQHATLVHGREDEHGRSAKAEQIGFKVDVLKYVAKEWRSDTANASVMKKGYYSVYHDHDLQHIQVIKGDNYCAIRSVIYQVLVDGRIQLLENLGAKDDIAQKLQVFQESGEYGLHKWSFGNNIKLHKRNSVYDQVQLCVQQLFTLIKKMSETDDREEMLFRYLNNAYDSDVEIMEAVKILMMLKAIDLHEKMLRDEHPMFVMFMFARDTSETLQLLFKNHINNVGDTGGLEQIEMILLAHTLGINIVVFRIKSFSQSDFRTEYNDESENLMAINIVAEDDRHYNILR